MKKYGSKLAQLQRTFSSSWINDVITAINRDEQFNRRSLNFHANMHLCFGSKEYILKIFDAHIVHVEDNVGMTKPWDFSLRAAKAIWTELLSENPAPCRQSIFALMKNGDMKIEGNLKIFMQHVWAILRIIDIMRDIQEDKING